MKHQEKRTCQSEKRLLELACRQREEEVEGVIAAGYRQGLRRVNRRHTFFAIVIGLCLVAVTINAVGWLWPYRMSAGDRTTRIAAYDCTKRILS